MAASGINLNNLQDLIDRIQQAMKSLAQKLGDGAARIAGAVQQLAQQAMQTLAQALSSGATRVTAAIARLNLSFAQIGNAAQRSAQSLYDGMQRFAEQAGSLQQRANLQRTSASGLRALTETAKGYGVDADSVVAGLSAFRQELEATADKRAEVQSLLGFDVTDENGELADTVTLLTEIGKKMRGMRPEERASFASNLGIGPDTADLISQPGFYDRYQNVRRSTNESGIDEAAILSERMLQSGNQIGRAFDQGRTILFGSLIESFLPSFERFAAVADEVIPSLARAISSFMRIGGAIGGVFLDFASMVLSVVDKVNSWTNGFTTQLAAALAVVYKIFGPQATQALVSGVANLAKSVGIFALKMLMRHPVLAVIGAIASWFLGREESTESLQEGLMAREERLAVAERVLRDREEINPNNTVGINKSKEEVRLAREEVERQRKKLAQRKAVEDAQNGMISDADTERELSVLQQDVVPVGSAASGADQPPGGMAPKWSATAPSNYTPGADFAAAQGHLMMARPPANVSVQSTNYINVSGMLDPQQVAQRIASVQAEVNNNLLRTQQMAYV